MAWFRTLIEKLNPAQREIQQNEGEQKDSTSNLLTYRAAYERLEIVNRGVNIVVDSAAEIGFDIDPQKISGISISDEVPRPKKLEKLLNFKPSPLINADTFRRNIYMDLILEGDAFIYFDGAHLYNLPAKDVTIVTDAINYIKGYTYNTKVNFLPTEVIHIRENSARSIYRGTSRLSSSFESIKILHYMNQFQENFFQNGTVPGIVLQSKDTLSEKIKNRIRSNWTREYSPKSGGRKPIILDSDFTIQNLGSSNFKELDFAESILTQEKKILKAIGVPPILLDAGNNANIAPNQKLLYTATVIPLVLKVTHALEAFFGYDLKPAYRNVIPLRPEMRDEAAYYAQLVNAGIITRNEARGKMRWAARTEEDFADHLILPQNIAGSAVDTDLGGRPDAQPED